MRKSKSSKEYEMLLTECEFKRLEMLENELEKHKKFQGYQKEEHVLYEKLVEIVPKEYHNLLIDYNSVCQDLMTIQNVFYYKRGFGDSMLLSEMMLKGRKDVKLDVNICLSQEL